MNPFEMVIAIVAITTIGSIIRAKYMGRGFTRRDRERDRFGVRGFVRARGIDDDDGYEEDRETVRLREEVKMLKDRIQTLERITVDKENSLARQIDDLRGR